MTASLALKSFFKKAFNCAFLDGRLFMIMWHKVCSLYCRCQLKLVSLLTPCLLTAC
jgi:hypothetical protein